MLNALPGPAPIASVAASQTYVYLLLHKALTQGTECHLLPMFALDRAQCWDTISREIKVLARIDVHERKRGTHIRSPRCFNESYGVQRVLSRTTNRVLQPMFDRMLKCLHEQAVQRCHEQAGDHGRH